MADACEPFAVDTEALLTSARTLRAAASHISLTTAGTALARAAGAAAGAPMARELETSTRSWTAALDAALVAILAMAGLLQAAAEQYESVEADLVGFVSPHSSDDPVRAPR
ncbi:MAG: hypothetical protein ACYCXA_09295 [Actinomycetes bacterium]